MRKIIITSLFFASTFAFSQTIKATTDDGRKVLLNSDKTWDFADKNSENSKCGISQGFTEPKSEKSVYYWLKKFDATTDDLKKHVAVENEVPENSVILLSISEQKGNGMYVLCVDGKKMKYRRTGSVFSRLDEDILKPKN